MSLRSSPRTWGCFRTGAGALQLQPVFPTHVGVFPSRCVIPDRPGGLPHARGGVSRVHDYAAARGRSSPRTWGCFPASLRVCVLPRVFPTHVGVFPGQRRGGDRGRSLPHARGGVSKRMSPQKKLLSSSPRTWGCFRLMCHLCSLTLVFPTHVGVFPSRVAESPRPRLSSPRTWGCFYLLTAPCR